MQKKLRILPYKPGSKSAKVIARALNGLRVRFNGTFRPRLRHFVVNWGKAERPRWWTHGLNDPQAVLFASNKASAFVGFKQAGVTIPEFTTNLEEAQRWVNSDCIVVGRQILNGHGGIGCLIFGKETGNQQVQPCPLYTKHIRHKREFRIHVFKGRIIDEVEKLKQRGFEGRQAWIRNHENGYVFARNGINVPETARQEAIKAVQALGLDFGAVDIAYREKESKAFVLEVNTAPGIEGTTIQKYIDAIQTEMVS